MGAGDATMPSVALLGVGSLALSDRYLGGREYCPQGCIWGNAWPGHAKDRMDRPLSLLYPQFKPKRIAAPARILIPLLAFDLLPAVYSFVY
jgi:hypothetical protein